MSYILSARERTALNHLSIDHEKFLIKGEMPAGLGKTTLAKLVSLGLAEIGPSDYSYREKGWRITADGWRCMYGATLDEMMAAPRQQKWFPFLVWRLWRWPIVESASRRRLYLGGWPESASSTARPL